MRSWVLFISSLLAVTTAYGQQKQLRVASYNLRVNIASDGINVWANRKDEVKALIQYHDFDIVGTQEGFPDQLSDLSEMTDYASFGYEGGGATNTGEHIFYKKERFSLLDSGYFWLSETPDVPSFGWDAQNYKRICSWVKLYDKNTEKTVYLFNVHFDHQGEEARRQSAKLMVQKLSEIVVADPIICTGDFNSTPDSEQIQTMQAFLHDAYAHTQQPPYGPTGTFTAFKLDAELKNRIDYVFVSPHFNVLKYATLTDFKNQRYPSDHLPVVVDVALK